MAKTRSVRQKLAEAKKEHMLIKVEEAAPQVSVAT